MSSPGKGYLLSGAILLVLAGGMYALQGAARRESYAAFVLMRALHAPFVLVAFLFRLWLELL